MSQKKKKTNHGTLLILDKKKANGDKLRYFFLSQT